jgi:hypothetical protein
VSIRRNSGVDILFGADCQNVFFSVTATNAIAGVEHDGTEDSFDQTLHYTFGEIISISDIDSITIGNIVIPINS